MLKVPSTRKEFDGFAAFYASEIVPYLALKEATRQAAVKKFFAVLSVGVIVGVLCAFFLPVVQFRMHALILSLVVFSGVGYSFVRRASDDITHGIFKRICMQLKLKYRRKLDRPDYHETYRRLKLIPAHDTEEWEDEIRGERNGGAFTICEAHLKRRSKGKNKSKRTVFHGQLIIFDYPKSFVGETVVVRDLKFANRLTKPGKGFQNVGIASPHFEKIFEAWSTDQVEARDILDPIVLERFEELDRLFDGANVRAAFSGNKIYVALETGDKMNVGSMFKPLPGAERVETILKEFDIIFDLVDVLVKQVDGRLSGAFSVDAIKAR